MPPLPVRRNDGPSRPRVVCYCQTYFPNNSSRFVSMKPLLANNCGVTHIILAAIHINADPDNITLNDDSPDDPRFAPLWEEVQEMQAQGVKVLGMLGGAAKGSFERLDKSEGEFEMYYGPLRDMIRTHGLDGLDLDVEEEMSLPGIIRLIDRLKSDFGNEFIITLAPVATALVDRELPQLSGFDYRALEEARGSKIAWYNAQFYNGWGGFNSTAGYDMIVARGWDPNKVVVGLLTNPGNGSQGYVSVEILSVLLAILATKYPSFGGVMGWEYFNALPGDAERPWEWAACMSLCMGMKSVYDTAIVALFLHQAHVN
ncbi:hypothetical protein AJ80_01147 [Polytolypa hystricis UAMH7299]|uniref:GH18 domain-containing protein n=1 Tax=Polytolypa hystricis (strain UAMH7299) TaxID=1447883 RepID=A0A2B7Z1A7_POLH7|nr:hypothetical protein AJ80_01147 [Polytolypa hystricis UAMH7299]